MIFFAFDSLQVILFITVVIQGQRDTRFFLEVAKYFQSSPQSSTFQFLELVK